MSSMIGETILVNGQPVDNVLVEPGNSRDAEEISAPVGTVVDYTLRMPIAYTGDIHDAKVTVRGRELDTLTHGDHWNPQRVFGSWSGDWDMTVLVGRTLGDFTADIRIYAVSATVDALGDPVRTPTLIYDGKAQARMSYANEAVGNAAMTDPRSSWYFVIPWQSGFELLRPASTYVEHDGARYDATSIKDIDNRHDYLSIEAVRHG